MSRGREDVVHKVMVSADGDIQFADRALWLKTLSKFRGRPAEMILRTPKKKRTDPQNRYHFGVVIARGAEQLGYDDPYELHEALAMKFLREDPDPITGSPRRRHTPDTDTVEFSTFTMQCRDFLMRFCSEQGHEFYIPLPNEVED